MTQNVIDQFSGVVRKALKQFVREKVKNRLQSALEVEQDEAKEDDDVQDILEEGVVEVKEGGIVTTEEEVSAFQIVKAIGCKIVDVNRITMRDKVSYCGILLDDNNRKPICRLHSNTQQKRLGVFKNKEKEKLDIESIEEIYQYSNRIEETIKEYLDQ